MNDLTIWQLIICTSTLVWLLCGIEMYFVFRFARKKAILGKIEKDNYLSVIPGFCERFSANLYGAPIEVAIKDDFIYFINNGRCFCINIDEFISIKEKKGKYIFRLAKTSIANTKVFAIKCNDSAFRAKLFSLVNNNAKENEKEIVENDASALYFLNSTQIRIKKAGIIMLAVGVIGAALISIISLLLYRKIYFFDGYAYTGVLWVISFVLICAGIIALSQILKPKVAFIITGIGYIISFVFFALVDQLLMFLISTTLLIIGVIIIAVVRYIDDTRSSGQKNKAQILEKKRKNKVLYSKLIAVCLAIAIVITPLSTVMRNENSDPDGIDGWTQCYKCNKTGKVRNDVGFYVTCPRCDGVGYLPD